MCVWRRSHGKNNDEYNFVSILDTEILLVLPSYILKQIYHNFIFVITLAPATDQLKPRKYTSLLYRFRLLYTMRPCVCIVCVCVFLCFAEYFQL